MRPLPSIVGCVAVLFFASLLLAGGPARAAAPDVHGIIPPYNPQLDAVRAPAGVFGTGKVWHVGPTEQYKTLSSIAKKLGDGDVVEIDAGTYRCTEQSIAWSANDITVIGVGAGAVFDATGCTISGDKGIFNPRGRNMIIDNIAFIGARGPSNNDAGIRLDGGGYVYITRSYFAHSQNGVLLTPGAPANIVIDHSVFDDNGNCVNASGCGHNMYISNPQNADSFVLRFSYSHNADTGHEVKSRAQVNYILYNRLADEATGRASYEVDLPNGGLSYVIGNVIQKGPDAQNGNAIAYAEEGAVNPVQDLYIASNTIVNEDRVPDYRWALLLGPRVARAEMVNNLIVGLPSAARVVDGPSAGALQQRNNIITDSPGFANEADRIYNLTARSPAVHAGIDPGEVNGFSLAPHFEFQLPDTGVARRAVGALDVGAYEYTPGQAVPAVPTLTFASDAPIAFNTGATLTWSSAGVSYCIAGDGWSGFQPVSGRYASPPLTTSQKFSISCTGPGGSVIKSLMVSVGESPAAAALGHYTWRDIRDSKISTICAGALPKYADNHGVGAPCTGPTTGVYVPANQTWYLMGDAGWSNYYGNEIYGFNLRTMRPELVTRPVNIDETKEYMPQPSAGRNRLQLSACDAALHLKSNGEIVRAPTGILGAASWDPLTRTIIVGQGVVHGISACSTATHEFGGFSEDLWSFNPFASSQLPMSSTVAWTRLEAANNAFGSVSPPMWIFDPATGLAYTAGNRAYADRGGRLIDFNRNPPVDAKVSNAWPYGYLIGAVSVDTTHHWAMALGVGHGVVRGTIEMWDLNGLSMTRYNPSSPFAPAPGWRVTGDTDLLGDPQVAGLTYNPLLGAFVAWIGDSNVYFLYPNYRTRTIDIVAKIDIPDGPPPVAHVNLFGGFTYIASLNEYLAFSDVDQDFYLLLPPRARNVN
ncbi:MAG TPA: right-handed parallel beta-helix repeat-containing protein [Acetobacteraceae bacterium]|nr:right-handed parallel beta-helix repeat-containing protein [Acetobacteraceae bacterium]